VLLPLTIERDRAVEVAHNSQVLLRLKTVLEVASDQKMESEEQSGTEFSLRWCLIRGL